MNISLTTGARLFLVLASTLAVALVQIVHREAAFDRGIEEIKEKVLDDYLREVFPERLFGDQWGAAPDKAAIQNRITVFNERHWYERGVHNNLLRVRVTRAGPVRIDDSGTENGKPISIVLASGPSAVTFDLVAAVPNGLTHFGVGTTLIYFLAAIGVMWSFPHPARFNAFPLARNMAIVFDRKVSAGQSWGMYRLSHLGGGGALPGIALNNYKACNDNALRERCFMDVKLTYEKIRGTFRRSIADPELQDEFLQAMEKGFITAEHRVSDEAPRVADDIDVEERFRPFVRDDLFGFAILNVEDHTRIAAQLRLESNAIKVERPPAWLIGDYAVFYPACLFGRLIDEIRAGLLSAYGSAYNSARIFADVHHPFVSIEFLCSNLTITPRNKDRLNEFLDSQFEGGLKRIVMLMAGFGEVSIFDSQVGFQLSQRKRSDQRTNAGIAVRLDFRRIRPSELEFVRTCFSHH
jgi:hypothetical protein